MMRLIEMENGPESLTVMVQRDVADRIVAAPGTPAYGSLSVAVQFAMHAKSTLTLSPGSFFPPPKVRSSVVRLAQRPSQGFARGISRRFGRSYGVPSRTGARRSRML